MKDPSPRAHLYRLGAIVVAFAVAFILVREWAVPGDWNPEIWYRGGAVADNAAQPMIYGGISDIAVMKRNESCESCHAEEVRKFAQLNHKTVSCEACHGALADHVREDKKIAVALIDKSNWQCLNCHAPLISRPKDFPQFTMQIYMHEGHKKTTLCLECHGGHEPTQ